MEKQEGCDSGSFEHLIPDPQPAGDDATREDAAGLHISGADGILATLRDGPGASVLRAG
jgi:hypothetical protein